MDAHQNKQFEKDAFPCSRAKLVAVKPSVSGTFRDCFVCPTVSVAELVVEWFFALGLRLMRFSCIRLWSGSR